MSSAGLMAKGSGHQQRTAAPYPRRPPRSSKLVIAGLAVATASTAAHGAARTVVTLYGWGDQRTEELYRDFEAEFEQDHPDIDLQVTILNYGDYFQKVPVMVATGTAPDVMEVEPENSSAFGKFIEGGAFTDLMPYVRRDGFNLDRFFEPVIQSYMYKGTLPILPKKISSPDLVMYNQDLFEQAGVAYPQATWTWTEFVDMAKKLTRDTDGDGRPNTWALASNLMGGYDAALMNGWSWTDSSGTRVPVNDPRFYEALQFIYDLDHVYPFIAPAEVKRASTLPDYMFFATGQAAIQAGGRWYVSYFRPVIQNKFRWDATWLPIPANGVRVYRLSTEAWGIYRDSKVKDAAWTFLKWAAGPKGSANWARNGGSVPALKEVALSDAFLNSTPPSRQGNRLWLEAVAYARPYPREAKWARVLAKMDELFAPGWQGQQSFRSIAAGAEPILATLLREQ